MAKSPSDAVTEHPEPTQATVKSLYANAFRCAAPGCRRPLYSVDGETGVRTRNSHVSHICARRQHGPRWDEDQSSEANRSEANLVVLCLEHANEVDAPGWELRFRPETLRRWKAEQLSDFDRIQQGWAIPDEDVAAALAAPTFNGPVNLGGAGGAAPGAGGGGGGVVGAGHGGPGGAGGQVWSLDGTAGAPGAGGGGGGAIGTNAQGGGGGDGGEVVSRTFHADEIPDQLEIFVGRGGQGGEAGNVGVAGEDAVIRFRRPDGSFQELMRARGGGPGPGGSGTAASAPPPTVLSLLLANYAELRDGLLFVCGGGWSRWSPSTLPSIMDTWAVVTLDAPAAGLILVYRDPTGTIRGGGPLPLPASGSSNPTMCHCLVHMALHIDVVGRWTLEVHQDALLLAALPVEIGNAA